MTDTPPSQDVQVDLKPLFPTPVLVATLPAPERANAELERVIRERMETHPSTEHSNLGGWQSSWDMEDWGGPAFEAIINVARQIVARSTADREGNLVEPAWKINAWANVNGPGHGNEFHTHPGAFWSGTYYVNDGGVGDDPSLGGELELQDPRGVMPVMYAPHLTYPGPAYRSIGASEAISPVAGRMILFPSWLTHGVRPYRGEKERISIAFNFSL